MSLTDFTSAPGSKRQRYLEIAVPLLSFGFTLAGILLLQAGIGKEWIGSNFQYFAAGCLIGSCILAYLAWIRPRKDIVALSTPLYAFIFFVVPTDFSAGVTLQLLYAFSLTLLLVRLKYRFGGAAPVPGSQGEGPIDHYRERVQPSLPHSDPGLARNAAMVFIRFAEGDFDRAAHHAARDRQEPDGATTLSRAFAIVAEQAAHTKSGGAFNPEFKRFVPEDTPFLFHPGGTDWDEEQEYMAALDNALLLLYATGFTGQDEDVKEALRQLRPFAEKLSRV
jgi:hypothetical protein